MPDTPECMLPGTENINMATWMLDDLSTVVGQDCLRQFVTVSTNATEEIGDNDFRGGYCWWEMLLFWYHTLWCTSRVTQRRMPVCHKVYIL